MTDRLWKWKSLLPIAPKCTPVELYSWRLQQTQQTGDEWAVALHSDKSCKPLCLMTLQRGPRLDHPSEILRSSLSAKNQTIVGQCGASPVLYPSQTRSPFSFISDLLPSLLSSPSIYLVFFHCLFFSLQLSFLLPVFNSLFTYPH